MKIEDIFDESAYEHDEQYDVNDKEYEEYNAEEIYEFGGVDYGENQPPKPLWRDLVEGILIIIIYILLCVCYAFMIL